MTKVIKHLNFTASEAARLLSPKGLEIITLQLLEHDPRRTSYKLTQIFENMADLSLVNLAGAAALLYTERLAGPIDYMLSDSGLNTYYIITRNHLLGLESAKLIIEHRVENEPPEFQQLIYFSIFGSLVADAENELIKNPVLTAPTVMTLLPYFEDERYDKYDTIDYKPTPTDLMFYIRTQLNMHDRPFSGVFSKPAILAFSVLLKDTTTDFNNWVIANIPEEDRAGFSGACAEKLQGAYEHLLETIDWPTP